MFLLRPIHKILLIVFFTIVVNLLCADEMPDKSAPSNDSTTIGNLLGEARNSWQDVSKTLGLCAQASEIANRSNNKRLQLQTYFNIGVVHLEFYKNYNQTLSYLIKALELAKEVKDSVFIQRCYQTIGNTYSDLYELSLGTEDFKDAESNLFKALEINMILSKRKGIISVFTANNYVNLSDLYLKKQDDSLSLFYAQKAYDIYSKGSDGGGTDLASGNICHALLLRARKTKNRNDYLLCKEKFMTHYHRFALDRKDSKAQFDSLPGGSKFWASFNLHNHYMSMAEISIALNEGVQQFSEIIDKAKFYAQGSKNITLLINALKMESNYFEKTKPGYSLELKNKIVALQDSAYILEARKKNETLKAIFLFNRKEIEYNKVEAESKLKSAELDAEKNQLRVKNTLLVISVISIVIFCVFLFYLFSLNKKLNAKNKLVSEQRELILTKNRQITDSINFSKIIQDEILFSKEKLKDHLGEHFLLYLPKDIVSGDFYFIKENKSQLFVAVIDCTGHGTSGAMMTLHANSLLQPVFEAVTSEDSADYMNELNARVQSGFFATNDFEYGAKFGMDVSLLVINKKTKTASFCSTNHPLLIKTPTELKEFKPKKSTLAYSSEKYTSFGFEISNNWLYYLFTDGYYDQKGGEGAKKYLYKNFKELLSKHSETSMDVQLRTLNEEHLKWRGPYRQTDDITVLGFKLNL